MAKPSQRLLFPRGFGNRRTACTSSLPCKSVHLCRCYLHLLNLISHFKKWLWGGMADIGLRTVRCWVGRSCRDRPPADPWRHWVQSCLCSLCAQGESLGPTFVCSWVSFTLTVVLTCRFSWAGYRSCHLFIYKDQITTHNIERYSDRSKIFWYPNIYR